MTLLLRMTIERGIRRSSRTHLFVFIISVTILNERDHVVREERGGKDDDVK